jgi:acyl carrier protein
MFNFLSNPFRSDPIAERVRQVVSDQLGVPKRKIKPGHEFAGDLGANEGHISELMMALEDEFYIVRPQDDHLPFTVGQAIDFVKNELAKQAEDAAEHDLAEHNAAEYNAEEHDSAEYDASEHSVTNHDTAENDSTQNDGGEYDGTESDSAEDGDAE